VLARAYRRCVRRLARDVGSTRALCWGFWRRWMRPWVHAQQK
jgi:hypothetical protein